MDIGRMAKNMVLALVLPVALAIAADIVAGTWPFITLIVSALAFPIAGIIVLRTTMQELNKVIQALAPEEDDEQEASGKATATVDA